jgi:chemotaxis protein CheC
MPIHRGPHMSVKELTDIQREVLKEVGNIGAGHAATSLADIMKMPVGLTEPSVARLPITGIRVKGGYDEGRVAALHMDVLGAVPGEIVILFDQEESEQFVKRFLTVQIGEMEVTQDLIEATLLEIANIIGGSYLTALANLVNKDLLPSTPRLVYGALDEIIERLSYDSAMPSSYREAYLINNGFINERGIIHVQFLFVPHDDGLAPYLEAFGLG